MPYPPKPHSPFAFCGDYALALSGRKPNSAVASFAIAWNKQNLINVKKAMGRIGLVSRLPLQAKELYEFRKEYSERHGLKIWAFHNPEKEWEQAELELDLDLTGIEIVTCDVGDMVVPYIDVLNANKQAGRNSGNAFSRLTDCERLEYVEGLRIQSSTTTKKRTKSKLISIKVPEELLKKFRGKWESEGLKYQTQIKQLMKSYIKNN